MELRRRKLKVRGREAEEETLPPPWHGVPPALLVYRERSHRRLAAQTYQQKCARCIWGFQMPVEMIIDQWDPSKRRYRTETSVTVLVPVLSTNPDRHARLRAVAE